MKPRSRWKAGLVAGGLAAVLVVYFAHAALQTKQTLAKVNAMTQQMKTVCLGRLTVDVPTDADVQYGAASIAGVDFDATVGSTRADLDASVKAIRDRLAGKKNEFDSASLEKEADAAAMDFKATVLYYDRQKPPSWLENGKRVTAAGNGVTVEAFGLKDDTLYHFKAVNIASPEFEKNVEQLIAKFESRQPDGIPAPAGFCVERGLLHDPIPADDNEQATVFVAPKGLPDVAIRLDTAVQDTVATSLLERDANDPTRVSHPGAITTIRKGVRAINGIPGEEALIRIKNENGTTSHFAMWASKNKPGDVMAPAITFEIETGKGKGGERVNSSLSDEALLQLWDKVSGTLRFRTTHAAPAAKSAEAKRPLGDMATTGTPCPQSGYWECSDRGNVIGGRRKFFHAGERLPPVSVSGVPSFWQKLSGDVPAHRVDTVWTLVGYAEEPDALAGGPGVGDAAALPDDGNPPAQHPPAQGDLPNPPDGNAA